MSKKIFFALVSWLIILSSYSQSNYMNTQPTWSPDGEKILFVSRRDGNDELYSMEKDGAGQVRLTFTAERESEPRWSPNGTEILFNSERTGVNQIFKMNSDGTGQINLTNTIVSELQGTWSPTGDKIAFTSVRDGNAQIYIMNTDGSNQVPLLRTTTNVSSGIWSPDQKFMVCLSNSVMPNQVEFLKVDLTKKVYERLFDDNMKHCFFFDWFKDKSMFVFKKSTMVAPNQFANEIFCADLDFVAIKSLQKKIPSVISAKLSPENERLLIEANSTVYSQGIDGSAKLLTIGKNFHSPEWSPNGKSVVMVSAGRKMNIFVVNSDGSDLVQLTR